MSRKTWTFAARRYGRVCEWNSLRASRSAVGGTLAGRRRVALGRNPPVLPRAAGFAGKAAEGPRRA